MTYSMKFKLISFAQLQLLRCTILYGQLSEWLTKVKTSNHDENDRDTPGKIGSRGIWLGDWQRPGLRR